MASVSDLLLALKARQSPFQSLMEGAAQGFGVAQEGALDRASKLIALDDMRMKRQMEMEQAQRQAQKNKEIQAKLAAAMESKVQDGLRKTGEPATVTPDQKLAWEIKQDEKGDYSQTWKTVEPKAAVVKPPTGFRYLSDGTLEAIPGGPAEIKEGTRQQKFFDAKNAYVNKADIVLANIDKALGLTGYTTAGAGSYLSGMRGTSASDLDSILTTIKANIGFQELQNMRQNSPTGGALGQVSDAENRLLASVQGSLEQKLSPSELRSQLETVRRLTQKMRDAAERDAAGASAKAPRPTAAPATGPRPGTVEDGYRFLGGDPAKPESWEKL